MWFDFLHSANCFQETNMIHRKVPITYRGVLAGANNQRRHHPHTAYWSGLLATRTNRWEAPFPDLVAGRPEAVVATRVFIDVVLPLQ
jgi:hypothetical protein